MSPSRREQQVAIAQRLRVEGGDGEGLTLVAIAREMGISVSYASELLIDPTGEKTRARKRKYPDKRRGKRKRKKWTKKLVIEAIQEWEHVHGRPPTIKEWWRRSEIPDWCPTYQTVYSLFGKGGWNKAIEEAGFTPRPAHAPAWTANYAKPKPMAPDVRERMSAERKALYAENPDHPMFSGLKEGWDIGLQRRERRGRRIERAIAKRDARRESGS